MVALRTLDHKTRNLILSSSKRASRLAPTNPLHAQAQSEVRTFARELLRVRRQVARLATSKAQLESVGMQVREAFSVRKIEGSIKASTGIMRDVNSLVRLPELEGTMRELGSELVKAGIIEEMVGDMLPDGEGLVEEDEEGEEEVERVLGEVLGKKDKTPQLPSKIIADEEEHLGEGVEESQEDEADSEALLERMRGRLEALKS
jgi:charged multivesicular body protein 3